MAKLIFENLKNYGNMLKIEVTSLENLVKIIQEMLIVMR
ncbi:hypothetical protein RO3G_13331 [Rhizopus delemar RA 99-880]|uniref:Uncharacterized protein n=1 Tax=Rhizopus delemar (strain RA 99-880 / ATCC MYA-4621 / FGSC 9543 / NRRL 43880) TaxID=246409 RepID=I1CJJ0_RHIO9|nr:hypothetical protein RO3G_13331 [Rhizopus delemar RA 99-880]|eukprot:EIE88620.1 hypothetical protein RO3G_13331 [Rhizopus delemar RA 99-880]